MKVLTIIATPTCVCVCMCVCARACVCLVGDWRERGSKAVDATCVPSVTRRLAGRVLCTPGLGERTALWPYGATGSQDDGSS